MSAHDQIRAMLDQLMGTGRDGENNKYKVKFDDPRVCKSFLLGCCPHDILASTRMDLGECPKIHDLALKADYEAASKHKDYYYDIDAMEHLANFIADCDRRTELAKRRLKETQEELSEEATGKAETIHQLGEEIGTKLAKAEQVGADGHVDESMNLMQEIEDLKKQKASAEIEYRNSMPASSYQQQKLRVCDVCSAYLGIHDNDRRLADHFGGKLHLGFITIRDKLEELKKSVQDRRHQREIAREDRKRERELEQQQQQEAASEARSRSRSREKQRERSKSRERGGGGDREREREREREQRSSRSRRSRSRSRDRRRRRSRSGERSSRRHRSRSRSRDRDRHARSRRSRSRSRSKRSRRSRSRSHSRRSRSGSRRSRRSRSRSASRQSYSKHRSRSGSKEKTHDRSNSKPREEEEEHRNGDGEAEHHNSRESPERQ